MCAGHINDCGVSFVMLVLEAYLGLTAQTLCLQNGEMLSKPLTKANPPRTRHLKLLSYLFFLQCPAPVS